MKSTADKLIANFFEYYQSNSAKKAVIGVSGGVDSACTLAIAVNALGADKVYALLMPHKDFSRPENLNDARFLVQKYEVEYREIEISTYCEAFIHDQNFELNEYVFANIMSRLRMVLLYAKANFFNGIVLGTSNKTEIMTGFFTKYGDGGIDVEVIGSLWKTEVFELAKYFGLENIANKKPTAELVLNHYDEDEIGCPYSEIDLILKKIEKNKNFTPKTPAEKKVFLLYLKNAHKRQMPSVISIF